MGSPVVNSSIRNTMDLKIGVVFLLTFSFSLVLCQKQDCNECIDFIEKSAQLFSSDEVVVLTEEFLKIQVCPQLEDALECEKGIEKWYKPMMKAGLESDDFGTRFCYHYGICIQHNSKNLRPPKDKCGRCIQGYNHLSVWRTVLLPTRIRGSKFDNFLPDFFTRFT